MDMSYETEQLNEEERLKAENDFLKMKIMLERGARFYEGETAGELPAEIENEFLNNIVAFEKQFDERKTIKVFDRIGKPRHFKPVDKIADSEIDEAYNLLTDYLEEHGVGFAVCSPNISTRELYRFVTEELFDQQMDDINLPGWTTNFIYDEFYPDPVYDNSSDAEDCIRSILRKEPLEFMYRCRSENLELNEHHALSENKCIEKINTFKLAYDNLEVREINVVECTVDGSESSVSGNYDVTAISGNEEFQLTRNWRIKFEMDEDFGYWYISNIQVEGVKF
jgi:hypothetical protein